MKKSQNLTAPPLIDPDPALSRRGVMSQVSGAVMALMVSEGMTGSAQAHGRRRRVEGTVEVLPDGVLIELQNTQVLVLQVAEEQIAVEIALADDPTNPIYTSLHSGVLTEEKIDLIARIGRRGVDPDDVRRYLAMLRHFGLTGSPTDIIAVVLGIIIAIIIICAIIGWSFGVGYEDDDY